MHLEDYRHITVRILAYHIVLYIKQAKIPQPFSYCNGWEGCCTTTKEYILIQQQTVC